MPLSGLQKPEAIFTALSAPSGAGKGAAARRERGKKVKKKSQYVQNKMAETMRSPKDAQVVVLMVPTCSVQDPTANGVTPKPPLSPPWRER